MNRKKREGGRQWVSMLAALVVMIVCASASAEEEPGDAAERAEQHYRMAVQFYGQGRYRESVEEFDRALRLHDDPVMHCNRAVPLIKLEELQEARDSLHICRESYPEGSADRVQLDAEVGALEVIIGSVAPRSVQVARDIASRERFSAANDAGALLPGGAAGVQTKPARLGALGRSGLVLLGVGALSGAGAVAVDVMSADMVRAFRIESEGGRGSSAARHEELRREIQIRQRFFWALTGAGVGLSVLGVGLFGLDFFSASDEGASGEQGGRIYFQASGDGVRGGFSLRF